MAKHWGKCALCGKEDYLTFEHIPPKAAFNSSHSKPVTLQTILRTPHEYPWDLSGMKYIDQQSGLGVYSLCKTCNNLTGSWYGSAYTQFAKAAMDMLCSNIPEAANGVQFEKIYPLQIIKQILSMFCSANPTAAIDDLRAFVLDKNAQGIDKSRYQVRMYFTKTFSKRSCGLFCMCDPRYNSVILASEITVPPFGFVLYIDPPKEVALNGFDITSFTDLPYETPFSVSMPLLFYEVNNYLPFDYRSKEEITTDINTCEEFLRQRNASRNEDPVAVAEKESP